MNQYTLEFLPCAKRQFYSLPKVIQMRLDNKLLSLQENPRPSGVKKMEGFENRWRIRVGDYRIAYEIYDRRLVILVVDIDHRRNIYR